MNRIAFLDTETTGLDSRCHSVWEIGLILRDPDEVDREISWQVELPEDPVIDPAAAEICRLHDRYGESEKPRSPEWTAEILKVELAGRHIVGAVPSFDTNFLAPIVAPEPGDIVPWHYHLIDVEVLALGFLAARGQDVPMPFSSAVLASMLGVDPVPDKVRHTALGDALWVRDWYDAMGMW